MISKTFGSVHPGRLIFAVFLLLALFWHCPLDAAQGPELMRLVDSPTAGLINKGRYGVAMRMFPEGGIVGQIQAGVLNRLGIGVSYGGERIIGDRDINWYPRVEVALRYRIIEENQSLPAIVIGYETQGFGREEGERYQIKSKGTFLAASKNYLSSLGQFGIHGGANLSREDRDSDGDLSGWFGVDKDINENLSIVAEWDLALNDNSEASPDAGNGYLNIGAHVTLAPELTIAFYLKNVLRNGTAEPDPSRELAVLYTEEF